MKNKIKKFKSIETNIQFINYSNAVFIFIFLESKILITPHFAIWNSNAMYDTPQTNFNGFFSRAKLNQYSSKI